VREAADEAIQLCFIRLLLSAEAADLC